MVFGTVTIDFCSFKNDGGSQTPLAVATYFFIWGVPLPSLKWNLGTNVLCDGREQDIASGFNGTLKM